MDNAAEVEQGFFADPQHPLPPGVTDAHRAAYLERGWVCLEAQLGEGQLAAARAALEARFELEGEEGGSELGQTIEDPTNPGVRRLCNLMGKAPEFLSLALHPAVLAFARLTIGPEIRWQAMNAHDPVAGAAEAHQPMHADRMFFDGCVGYMNCIWALDEFTPERGGTRLLTASHRRPWPTADELEDPIGAVPGEEQVSCPAGSLILTHGDLWHGGCANHAAQGVTRRAIHLGFACPATRPQYDISAAFAEAEARAGLGEEEGILPAPLASFS